MKQLGQKWAHQNESWKRDSKKQLGGRTKPVIRARYEFVTSFLRFLLELILFVHPHCPKASSQVLVVVSRSWLMLYFIFISYSRNRMVFYHYHCCTHMAEADEGPPLWQASWIPLGRSRRTGHHWNLRPHIPSWYGTAKSVLCLAGSNLVGTISRFHGGTVLYYNEREMSHGLKDSSSSSRFLVLVSRSCFLRLSFFVLSFFVFQETAADSGTWCMTRKSESMLGTVFGYHGFKHFWLCFGI